MNLTREQIIKWVIGQDDDFQLYTAVDDFEPPAGWDGSAEGENGEEIHQIAATDTSILFGETTESVEAAAYLVCPACIVQAGTAIAAIEALLDLAFGPREEWPDNYCQTHGWEI